MWRSSPSWPSAPQVNMIVSPGLSSTVSSFRRPRRSLGPGRSWRIATGRPARPDALRTSSTFLRCSSTVPCEKFRRATSIPASTIRTRISGSWHAGPIVATIFVRRISRTLRHEAPVLLDRDPIGRQAAAFAQVADEIPVPSALVAPAGLRVRAAQREVHGAADLLVEEDRADRAVDAEVRPDADLAQAPRARVGVERLAQVALAALRARLDDLAVAEDERHAAHVDAGRRGGDVEVDAAIRAGLVRAGEDLAAGHVAPAVGVHPCPLLDAEREVGPVGL